MSLPEAEPLRVSWGRRIKRRMDDLQMTQEHLAVDCSTYLGRRVHQGTISRIVQGERAPSEDLKWALAAALGCTLEDLFAYPAVRPVFPDAEAVGQ